ncbi:MAG TPA: hypothetical protein VG842_10135, partial [Sediminibacterium sp.]|nr:hypothetical protein [Sediminibacterium sp.]
TVPAPHTALGSPNRSPSGSVDKSSVTGKITPKTNPPATSLKSNHSDPVHKTPETAASKNTQKKTATGRTKPGIKSQNGTGSASVPAPPAVADKSREEVVATARGNTAATPDKAVEMKTSPQLSIPKVLLERANNLVKTITVSEPDIEIDLYDNGTIDNDSISVYHNNELVVSHARLTYTPIVVKIKCTREDGRHEITIVAENLGDIPPNSALMVVKAGRERHEVSLDSNEQTNAKVVIQYQPKNK